MAGRSQKTNVFWNVTDAKAHTGCHPQTTFHFASPVLDATPSMGNKASEAHSGEKNSKRRRKEELQKKADWLGVTLDHAQTILTVLKNTGSLVPGAIGLKEVSSALSYIITMVQDQRDVEEGFRGLVADCCKFQVIVVRHAQLRGDEISKPVANAIEEARSTLKVIQDMAKKLNKRRWWKKFFGSNVDKGKVAEMRENMKTATHLFSIEVILDTNHAANSNMTTLQTVFEETANDYEQHPMAYVGNPYPSHHQAQSNAEYQGNGSDTGYPAGYHEQPFSGQQTHESPGSGYYYPQEEYQGVYYHSSPPYDPPGYSYHHPHHHPKSYPPSGPSAVNNIGSVGNANFGVNYGTITQNG
ncbi:hypothetical protein NMY22_g2776 [Coprinellus aureogranulatus]|nr:hypothetical protein NMY22_g2776 [Coprinellus aureogranulatus]